MQRKQVLLPETQMVFLGFGTMNGKDGKPFKTREGGVMRLEKLIADIDEAVYQRIMENRTVSEEEAKDSKDRRSCSIKIRRSVKSGFQGLYL